LVRTRVSEVSTVGRNTQGVRLIRTAEDEHVVGLQRIDEIEVLEVDEDELLEATETTDTIESTDGDISPPESGDVDE
jgi:DNA gyrase subunit A